MLLTRKKSKTFEVIFDVDSSEIKISELENSDWSDKEVYAKSMREIKVLQTKIENYKKIKSAFDDVSTLIEIGAEENDSEIISEAENSFKKFASDFENIRVSTLLSGEYDAENALVMLHSGAGGTEACDWVSMLFRMYSRFAEKMGFKSEVLDYLEGEEAGIKSVTLKIAGENAYGYLKSEKGVHRLVRISPFDASGKRHTSFASCDVMPELNDEVTIKIDPDDIRVDTYRSSGAGGQHVNKTDSAIRLTHFPTGIVVSCQNERSQRQNKETAMKILRGRLFELKEQERLLKLKELRGEVKEIGWGSQIRSYVFQPYSMVKDHRTNEETGNVGAVMDGSIISFINAYLTWIL